MHHVKMPVRRIGSLLAALWLVGCAGDAPETPAPSSQVTSSGSAVLTERARVLDDESLRALSRVSSEGDVTELAFSSSTSELGKLAIGDVLIAGVSQQTPYGGLYAVERIETASPGLVVY